MNKPWVGKGIWNKVYKGKMLNVQDNSGEIRKKGEIEEIESKKEEIAIESAKEGKEIGLEEKDVVIEPEREEMTIESKREIEETGSVKEGKEIRLEEEDEETESVKESKEIGLEEKDVVIEPEKEEMTIESKKESEETGSVKDDKEIRLEEEDEETESEEEEIAIESKKESKKIGLEKKSIDSGSKIETSVRSIVVKTPFSIISDVTSFIKFPNINVKTQEAFVFRNEQDIGGRELDAKLLTTVQHYHGEVNCNLISSNLYEERVLLELPNQKVKGNMEENWVDASSWIPIHGIILEKEDEADVNNYITAKLPIEIGRYKGEISLQEKVEFKEKVIGIKEVSQEIILTKKEFLLPKIIKEGNNPSKIEKGSLLVEGYIFQCIEFISERSISHENAYQLIQNIVLELTVQLLQEQEAWVRII
ncbi:BC_2427 family protein [Bacillus cereus]|uniref:BC_2427 family protein n=1 Tax=Bacillus cereus TaxID=1396 RepID=UPI00027A93A8|nr:hypothetical protein [Bacillus cereus]EJS68776.1 hypothetical protein ICU_02329 [Bacillus cereus BAG2X1-1]PEA09637.1 hypothetical protein CON38_11265 [Bacillus cereus]PFI15307.1 hypothetical protein COI75_25240 [Bacillus cereus]